jgi:hypothetical protein
VSVWLRDLAAILRDAGVPVIEETYNRGPYKGKPWQSVGFNNRGLSSFSYVVLHHDASPVGDSPGALEWVKYMQWAPAGACWVCHGCGGKHASGTWHIYAAGLTSHAGTGGPWNPTNGAPSISKDNMNSHSLGIETDHTFGESWKPEVKQQQLAMIRLGIAAILRAYNMPANRLIRHLDWTNGLIDGNGKFATFGRKNDIDGLDLNYERSLINSLIAQLDKRDNGRAHIKELRKRITDIQEKEQRLKAAGRLTKDVRSEMRARIRRIRERIRSLRG